MDTKNLQMNVNTEIEKAHKDLKDLPLALILGSDDDMRKAIQILADLVQKVSDKLDQTIINNNLK